MSSCPEPYHATRSASVSASACATFATASSQVAFTSGPPFSRRIIGCVSRSGSENTCPASAPFGHIIPKLGASAGSAWIRFTALPSTVAVNTHPTPQYGQTAFPRRLLPPRSGSTMGRGTGGVIGGESKASHGWIG